jgi:hypothetical protein
MGQEPAFFTFETYQAEIRPDRKNVKSAERLRFLRFSQCLGMVRAGLRAFAEKRPLDAPRSSYRIRT